MHALASSLGIPSNEKHSKICYDPNWSVFMIRARLATGSVRILHGNWRNTAKRIDCELIQARNFTTVCRFFPGASTWFRQILFLVSALHQRQHFFLLIIFKCNKLNRLYLGYSSSTKKKSGIFEAQFYFYSQNLDYQSNSYIKVILIHHFSLQTFIRRI